ncbi:unnamed protein product [Clavelina lepadiformis]|uniref:Uncharacterized protein n=1 Tax=Clavelina lepadiformis TaxID=159417 RepID=A0ABP0GIF7_CLALP
MTEKRIKHLKNRQLKIIDNACLKLEQVGYVVGGAIYKDGLFDVFGCKTATHFFSGTSFQEAFINENHLATFLSDKPSTSRSLKILKKEVRAIFNEKYSEAVKKNNQRLPYSKLNELGISMLGLPSGVFKKPSRVWSAPESEKDMLEVVVLEG